MEGNWVNPCLLTVVVGFPFEIKAYGIETCILSSVKQITSPGWMHETSA